MKYSREINLDSEEGTHTADHRVCNLREPKYTPTGLFLAQHFLSCMGQGRVGDSGNRNGKIY